jgi:hypothetical protein
LTDSWCLSGPSPVVGSYAALHASGDRPSGSGRPLMGQWSAGAASPSLRNQVPQHFRLMHTDEDIERCARSMIRQYGADAAARARRQANEALLRGAPTTGSMWADVAAKIECMQTSAGK